MRLIDADRLLDRCIFYHLPNGDLAVPIIDVQHAPTVEAPDINVGNMDTTTHDSIPAETGENDGDRTSGDCISRQQAIDKFKPWLEVKSYGWGELNMIRAVINELENMPSAQPFHNITLTDVLEYIDDMPEDVWQEFTACLECRGWELQRRTAKWCGGDFA